MTFQAQIVVALDEQLRIDRTVWIVARAAAFPERFVFEDEGPGLTPVTLSTRLIGAANWHLNGRVDIRTVWIVAGGAIHPAFLDRVVILKAKLGFCGQVTLEASARILAGDDELAFATAGIHMQAARAVTTLAT